MATAGPGSVPKRNSRPRFRWPTKNTTRNFPKNNLVFENRLGILGLCGFLVPPVSQALEVVVFRFGGYAVEQGEQKNFSIGKMEEGPPVIDMAGSIEPPPKFKPSLPASYLPDASVTMKIPSSHPMHPLHPTVPGNKTAKDFTEPGGGGGIAAYLELLSGAPHQYTGYTVHVSRRGPITHDGETLPLGLIHESIPTALEVIKGYIRDTFGGGSYALEVTNSDGKTVQKCNFDFSAQMFPPMVRCVNESGENGMRPAGRAYMQGWDAGIRTGGEMAMAYPSFGRPNVLGMNPMGMGSNINTSNADSAIIEIKKKKDLAVAQSQAEEAEAALEYEREKRELKRKKLQEEFSGQPKMVETVLAKLEAAQKETKQDMKEMLATFTSTIEKVLATVAVNKTPDRSIEVMLETMKTSQQNNAELVKTLILAQGTNKGDVADAAKSSQAMFMEHMKSSMEKNERLTEKLMERKLNDDNGMKQFAEQFKMYREITDSVNPPEVDDNETYNPKIGLMGNLGALGFSVVKNLTRGNGFGELLQGLAQGLVSQPPAQQQALPMPVSAPVPVGVGSFTQGNRILEHTAPRAVSILPEAVPVRPAATGIEQQKVPFFSDYYVIDDENVAQGPAILSPEEFERNQPHVNEVLEVAYGDITDERVEPEWPIMAAAKFSKGLKLHLAAQENPVEIAKVLLSFTDQATAERLQALLMTAENEHKKFRDWVRGCELMVHAFAQEEAVTNG